MPWFSKPLIIGSAVKLVVYAGTPNSAAVKIASGDWEPNEPDIQLAGTYKVIRASNIKASAINLPTIQVALIVSLINRLLKEVEMSLQVLLTG